MDVTGVSKRKRIEHKVYTGKGHNGGESAHNRDTGSVNEVYMYILHRHLRVWGMTGQGTTIETIKN